MSNLDAMKAKSASSLEETPEVEDDAEEEESHRPIKGIFSYGADYTVDGLVKRVRDRSYDIPRFQRKDVWTFVQKSRFIESLLLDLPVPGIFVAEDPGIFISKEDLGREGEKSRHIVIDGHQRLLALRQFCDTEMEKGKRLRLVGVQDPWNNKYFHDLPIDDRRRLEDSIIHTTIIKQRDPGNSDAILEVFHRLNTGGNLLSAQEIRVAVSFSYEMSNLLEEITESKDWKRLYGKRPSKRMKDQELILRFWALYEDYEKYKDPMRGFLDGFYKKASSSVWAKKRGEFSKTFSNVIKTIRRELDRKAFRPERSINAAVFDSVMVGIAKRLDSGEIKSRGEVEIAYDNLMKGKKYRDACQEGTSKIVKVTTRISAAIDAFKGVR